MRTLAVTLVAFSILLLVSVKGSAEATDGAIQERQLAGSFGSVNMKRTYPGGRDDSDLTVQPKKRITKKESDADHGGEPEEDIDQGDVGGFGE